MLFDYTKRGGKAVLADQGVEFDSGMPGFGDDLGDEEIWNILAFIQSTWPELQLQLQAERTRFDNERGGN
jgi:mono/diheme cytochrome c family protein